MQQNNTLKRKGKTNKGESPSQSLKERDRIRETILSFGGWIYNLKIDAAAMLMLDGGGFRN